MTTATYHFSQALLPEGWAENVRVTSDAEGFITSVEHNANAAGAHAFPGAALPALANVHSHAHQRAITGLTERAGLGDDSFWTWREAMYRFLGAMTPEDLQAIAAQAYVEMLKAGFTCVGEFQYLHNCIDGSHYDTKAEMSLACLAAAREVDIGFTALPVLYAYGGFGAQDPVDGQKRFIHSAESFLEVAAHMVTTTADAPHENAGIAPHSLRAVDKPLLEEVLTGLNAMSTNAPVHIHIAEQVKEVEDCIAWCGKRPVEHWLETYDVNARWCAIHATHMSDAETEGLARSGAVAGLCPTTEANLGDGIFPAKTFTTANGAVAIGSDSHITISPADDLRILEYSQRLRDRARNVLADGPGASTGRSLYDRAARGGAQAMGLKTGQLAEGMLADIIVLDDTHPALVARSGDDIIDSWIFFGGDACVRDVISHGKHVVQDRHHAHEEKILARFRETVSRLQDA
ncbi:MAG: formimidoylglutamate deiminase [Hyphomicrobiales bacterium]